MARSLFANIKVVASSSVDTTVSALEALDNIAQVGVIASGDWRKQAQFESALKDKARAKILSNDKAISAIENQLLEDMLGDYLPANQMEELFALPK